MVFNDSLSSGESGEKRCPVTGTQAVQRKQLAARDLK